MNNGSRDVSGRDMSTADLQKLQQQLQDIKEQVGGEGGVVMYFKIIYVEFL